MNELQYLRNLRRIPRLAFHIKRCAGQDERVAGFKDELERRKMEMTIAGHKDLLAGLLKVKLTPQADDESENLLSVVNPVSNRMTANAAMNHAGAVWANAVDAAEASGTAANKAAVEEALAAHKAAKAAAGKAVKAADKAEAAFKAA